MPDTAELSIQERGILATTAAAYVDEFSRSTRRPISVSQPVLLTRSRKYYSRGQEWYVEWQDYGQPLPAWFDPLMQGFADVLTLPPNWDSYGAGPLSTSLVDLALTFINGCLNPSSPAPRVVPLSSGGLQLEWHRKGIDLEIVFELGEQPYFYALNRATGEETEHILPEGAQELRSIIEDLE